MRRHCDDIQPTGIRSLRQESWFLARCFEHLAPQGLRGIVSFADPVPRRTSGGQVICPGHVGTISQATNAVYTGRSTPRTVIVLPDGTSLNDRAIQKVRRQKRGHHYVEARLCPRRTRAPRRGATRGLAHAGPGVDRGSPPTAPWLSPLLPPPLGLTRRARQQVRIGPVPGRFPKVPDPGVEQPSLWQPGGL